MNEKLNLELIQGYESDIIWYNELLKKTDEELADKNISNKRKIILNEFKKALKVQTELCSENIKRLFQS